MYIYIIHIYIKMSISKPLLRKKFLLIRKVFYQEKIENLSPLQYSSFYTSYLSKLLILISHAEAPITAISGFHPIKNEPDCIFLLDRLQIHGFVTALPYIEKKNEKMRFLQYITSETKFTRDIFGTLAPDPSLYPVIQPQIFIVPLLAFSSKGGRLGYGGGYYDRYLGELRENQKKMAKTVGLAFECLKCQEIQNEIHDIPLDYVITEKEIYKTGENLSNFAGGSKE